MNADLREYVLSLPLDVRRELAKCDGPYWHLVGTLATALSADSVRDDPLDDLVTVRGPHRRACLPVSPIAIALHAAKLSGAVGQTVETFAFRTTASVRLRVADVVPGGKLTASDYADDDETGHRAAIGLLMKVMER